jgi:NhaP-type Na+/H+ or K+/H+ antiporter
MFYLLYALNHGVTGDLAGQLVSLTVAAVVTSIVLHGVSVTPLMAAYERRRQRRGS